VWGGGGRASERARGREREALAGWDTTDLATGGAAGPGTDKGTRRRRGDGGGTTAATTAGTSTEHTVTATRRTTWPIARIRPRSGRHRYSVDIWRDGLAGTA
jgi:hypothetical protein